MSALDYIMQTLPALSATDKLVLREALDRDLRLPPGSGDLRLPPASGEAAENPLLGLMADEPKLMDEIVEEAYAVRALPLRLPSNG